MQRLRQPASLPSHPRADRFVKHVLIAEDDSDLAEVLAEAIGERTCMATHVVANGALVPDAIAASRPDLLILDVSLPGLSGLDVFDLVRNDPHYRGVPELFLTGSPEKAESAFSLTGEHRVMAKPFDLDELIFVLEQMVDGESTVASTAPATAIAADEPRTVILAAGT
jgi:CheY-like chemotaxis protein